MSVSPAGACAPPIPALFTARLSAPKVSTASFTTRSESSGFAVSCFAASAVPPALVISPATRSADSRSISVTTTLLPRSASSLPIASPRPEPPPVTTATVPSNDAVMSPSEVELFPPKVYRDELPNLPVATHTEASEACSSRRCSRHGPVAQDVLSHPRHRALFHQSQLNSFGLLRPHQLGCNALSFQPTLRRLRKPYPLKLEPRLSLGREIQEHVLEASERPALLQ